MVRLNTTNWNDFVSAFPQVESRLIGFDRVFDAVTRLHTVEGGQSNSFPPYNIKRIDDENYEIQIAIAGFKKSELDVVVEDGNLIVKGEQEKSEDEFLHKFREIRRINQKIIFRWMRSILKWASNLVSRIAIRIKD